LFGAERKKKWNIGACDWSIGKSSDVGAFDIAKQIGLDGLMVCSWKIAAFKSLNYL
jgi:hypothetical protein